MDDPAIPEDLFPRAKSAPAQAEVCRQIKRRYTRLTQVQALIRNDKHSQLLPIDPIFLDMLFERWALSHPSTPFRLETLPSAAHVARETDKARTWLLRVTRLQHQHFDRAYFYRILRSAVEKVPGARTDLERLFVALTEGEEGDAGERLDYAFAVVLHYEYATRHEAVLKKLEELEERRMRLAAKKGSEEAVWARMLHKVRGVKVDGFACAVPVSEVAAAGCEEGNACPICRNGYFDFGAFPVADLLSDYPVKIKYCGHVVGKSCLETWMETPLADPAKYPYRTCPLCRMEIEGGEVPMPPLVVLEHVDTNEKVDKLVEKLGLADDECCDGILRLISEEVALMELETEVEGVMLVDGEDEARLNKARGVLKERLEELGQEKREWGFGGKEKEWAKARGEWIDAMMDK